MKNGRLRKVPEAPRRQAPSNNLDGLAIGLYITQVLRFTDFEKRKLKTIDLNMEGMRPKFVILNWIRFDLSVYLLKGRLFVSSGSHQVRY